MFLGEILSISTEVEITGQENTSWNSSEGVYDGNGDATFTSTITSDDYNELAGMTVSSSVYNSQGIATNPDLVSISSIEQLVNQYTVQYTKQPSHLTLTISISMTIHIIWAYWMVQQT
jgi:hypothetical protein